MGLVLTAIRSVTELGIRNVCDLARVVSKKVLTADLELSSNNTAMYRSQATGLLRPTELDGDSWCHSQQHSYPTYPWQDRTCMPRIRMEGRYAPLENGGGHCIFELYHCRLSCSFGNHASGHRARNREGVL